MLDLYQAMATWLVDLRCMLAVLLQSLVSRLENPGRPHSRASVQHVALAGIGLSAAVARHRAAAGGIVSLLGAVEVLFGSQDCADDLKGL